MTSIIAKGFRIEIRQRDSNLGRCGQGQTSASNSVVNLIVQVAATLPTLDRAAPVGPAE